MNFCIKIVEQPTQRTDLNFPADHSKFEDLKASMSGLLTPKWGVEVLLILAGHINDQVNYLIANCKLEPGADATLHVLIGELLTGATKVSSEPLSSQGMPQLVKTLQLYPDYFEHQGWNQATEK